MELLTESISTAWPFPFTPQDWAQTPPAVQAYVHTLHDELTQCRQRVEALEGRLTQNSATSQPPPSSDSPYQKPPPRPPAATPPKAAPAPPRCHAPESGWETGSSRPSPGALAADHSPGAAA